eukprot:759338-Hanusia_phi.AAC.2
MVVTSRESWGSGEAVRCFHEHKDEEWFWEKYHPDGQMRMWELRSSEARENYETFCQKVTPLNDVNWDTLDMPGVVMIADHRNHPSAPSLAKREENDMDNGKEKEVEEGEEQTVVVHSIVHLLSHGSLQANESAEKPENAEDENSAEASKEQEEPAAPTFTVSSWCAAEAASSNSVFIRQLDGTEVLPVPVEKEEGDDKEAKSEASSPSSTSFCFSPSPRSPWKASAFDSRALQPVPSPPPSESFPRKKGRRLVTHVADSPSRLARRWPPEDVEVGKKVDLLVHYLRRVHYYSYYKVRERDMEVAAYSGFQGEDYNDVGEMIRKGSATYVRPVLVRLEEQLLVACGSRPPAAPRLCGRGERVGALARSTLEETDREGEAFFPVDVPNSFASGPPVALEASTLPACHSLAPQAQGFSPEVKMEDTQSERVWRLLVLPCAHAAPVAGRVLRRQLRGEGARHEVSGECAARGSLSSLLTPLPVHDPIQRNLQGHVSLRDREPERSALMTRCQVFKAPEFVKKHLWNKHLHVIQT